MRTQTQEAGSDRADQTPAFSWKFVTPLFMGSALNPVNSTIIATALVPIATDLHVSVGTIAALVSALYLVSAVAQPTAGKLSEEFGPRGVFLTGILLVLLGGIGQNLATLLVARVLIGLGTSCGYPSAMLLIRRRATSAGMQSPPNSVALRPDYHRHRVHCYRTSHRWCAGWDVWLAFRLFYQRPSRSCGLSHDYVLASSRPFQGSEATSARGREQDRCRRNHRL
jgi:hypothetical protein